MNSTVTYPKRNFPVFLLLYCLLTIAFVSNPPNSFFVTSIQQLQHSLLKDLGINAAATSTNPLIKAYGFNSFTKESVGFISGDIEGPTAMGGDLTLLGSMTIAGVDKGTFKVSGDSQETGLLIGGKIIYAAGSGANVNLNSFVKLGNTDGSIIHDTQNGTLVNTRITAGDYSDLPNVSLQTQQSATSVAQSGLIDFTDAFAEFTSMVMAISSLPSTLTLSNNSGNGSISLQPNQLNVLNISGADLANFSTITFNQKPNATQPLVVNIDASGTFNWEVATFAGIGDLEGSYILFNFYNTDFLIFNGPNTLYGSVLAPQADFTKNTSGNINGQVVARIYAHTSGELHHHPLDFEVPIPVLNEEICGNGIDDDNDGLIDNYDSDCCANLSIIPQSSYALHYVDSEQSGYGEAANAFDRDTETIWHTDFNETTYPLPHEIQIDLGTTQKVGGLRYLPTQSFEDGRIKDYKVYVSDNSSSWGSLVATGTFTYADLGDKEVNFPPKLGRYVRLVALSEVNGNNWTTATEINILACQGQEICDDGIDNDGDGLIDCADPDCSANIQLSATTANNCGEAIDISVNLCVTYAQTIASYEGNVSSPLTTIAAPDGQGAFLNEVFDGTYTRMVFDFGEIIPDGEEVCFKVRCSSETVPSMVTIWLLNSGTPESGSYSIVTTQSFVGTEWQDLCFKMPRANRYVKITDDSGSPFYIDAVGRKCRAIEDLSYQWNTGDTTATISVNGAISANYSVQVSHIGGCVATETITVTGIAGCSEICGNGIDDDGDGFIDSGDADCASDCSESLLFIARDNAEILQVNLTTGSKSVAGQSPYTSENLNAMAANPDANIVYYGNYKTVYYWNPITGEHNVLIDLSSQVGPDESLTSGGGAYFNEYLYLGFEDHNYSDNPTIYRLPLAADGLSVTGAATNLNVPIPNNTSWGDMIVTSENNITTIYAGLGYNGSINNSLYCKYEIENDRYTTIRTDMPSQLQIGVDVDGNLWGGGLETGIIQQMDKNTGIFSGNSIFIGGDMWDLTGPINCPQQIEICGNGIDDDGDGRIDSDDDDCDCPILVTTDTKILSICEGDEVTFSVITDASNPPFNEIAFYRFDNAQSNPYATSADKTLLGKSINSNGMVTMSSDEFPTNGALLEKYYVYGLLSPPPSDLNDCLPFIEYVINVDACKGLEITCTESQTIETVFSGLKNNVPMSLSFSEVSEIDSILVQIVYENTSPGNSIVITDSEGNNYTLYRQTVADIRLYETVIPATSSITYTNEINEVEAQSIVAYVFRQSPNGGSYARYSQAVSGHANTRRIDFPLPDRVETRDVNINLPVSELTYDDRTLTFRVRAGDYFKSFTRRWGPNGDNFPNGCCIDFVEIEIPDVPPNVNNVEIELFSPGGGRGQSYIVSGTVFLEIECFDNEDCTDGIDNDNDGEIDQRDLDCSGYCTDNGTFLPYGMIALESSGFYSEEYDLTFEVPNTAYLIWEAGDKFYIKGTAVAYQSGNYIGRYTLVYTATGATYATYDGTPILGSTGGTGRLISQEPSQTQYDEILLGAKLNSAGWGIHVRGYGTNDIRIDGDWSLPSWTTENTFQLTVNQTDCSRPREICDNGIDDDGDGLTDCNDFDCTPPDDGGDFIANEDNCGYYNPMPIIVATSSNSTGNGLIAYQWEKSDDGTNWFEILGAINASYDPTIIFETTYYRRKVRKGNCGPWGYSNVITKAVTAPPFDAEIINAPGGNTGYLCADTRYSFQAANVDDANYAWDFGANAMPTSATGAGPHEVTFRTPTKTEAIDVEVQLTVIGTADLCVATDNATFSVHPLSEVLSVNSGNPSTCGADDGWIELELIGETSECIQVSLDGGVNFQPANQFYFTGLTAGSYEIVTRYCTNGCTNIAQIVNLSDPATINLVNDDLVDVCPGFNYSYNIFINDDIEGETVLTLASDANFGSVALEENGDFTYTSLIPTCSQDQFAYTVCDATGNCCATAVVTIDFSDTEAPRLTNVPEDLTVSCDDEIPLPPLVSAFDNCPAISIDKEEVSTQGEDGCSLYDYKLTYTWIATDFCGNAAVDSQQIFVQDNTAPDIYRVYTLPNGKKMVAGVMENVTQHWKVVQLPIDFPSTPLIFNQIVTDGGGSPMTVRMRNISENQFELRLQQEEQNLPDGIRRSVAWIVMEAGTQLGDLQLEAGLKEVSSTAGILNFSNNFAAIPLAFTAIQTMTEQDAVYSSGSNVAVDKLTINLIEEQSKDAETDHVAESLAYLALDKGMLRNQGQEVFGETDEILATTSWQTINWTNAYINPIVIANQMTQNEADPVLLEIRNTTANGFDIRLKEWDYLDGLHVPESVSYLVMEGSIPLKSDKFCEYGTDSLVLGIDIIAIDNCDQNVAINYEEIESFSGAQQIFTRSWSAVDECGNATVYAQEVTCEGVFLRMKAILQGPTIFSYDNLMRDDLRKKGLIPLKEPYSENPNFQHFGEGGGETVTEELLQKTGPDACVDWVLVELCDGNDIGQVVATIAALIQRDGDIITATGDTLLRFENVPPGNYYVALNHRNHLRSISLYPYTFTPNAVPMVDLTNEFTPVIGTEPNVDLGGRRALWAGDLTADDRVIYQGPQNDVFYMFLHVILDSLNSNFLTNFISSDYTDNDFNMDGTVIFQGPNNDKSTLLFNTTLKHPNNEANFSNFIIATHAEAQILSGIAPDNTTPGFDFDNDGLMDSNDPDDDNDGVADGNDVSILDPNSDSDGDGISDKVETGGDGKYDPNMDTDPLNPCDPQTESSTCVKIDADGDGYFRNYPIYHPLYDAYDENPCLPNNSDANCPCVDEDEDGYVIICYEGANKLVRFSALSFYLNQGSTCGSCN